MNNFSVNLIYYYIIVFNYIFKLINITPNFYVSKLFYKIKMDNIIYSEAAIQY